MVISARYHTMCISVSHYCWHSFYIIFYVHKPFPILSQIIKKTLPAVFGHLPHYTWFKEYLMVILAHYIMQGK